MPRISIQQFRAALAGSGAQGGLLRAYRELARTPELAARVALQGWPVWEDGAASASPARVSTHRRG